MQENLAGLGLDDSFIAAQAEREELREDDDEQQRRRGEQEPGERSLSNKRSVSANS